MRRLEPGRMRPGYGPHMCGPDSGTCAAVNYTHIREAQSRPARPRASTATLSTTLLGTMIGPSSVANVV
jgi:hypothetical protein